MNRARASESIWLRLLEAVSHPADRRWIVADALEEFDRIEAESGERKARRWLRRQALRAVAPGIRERWRRRGRPSTEAATSGRSDPLGDFARDLRHSLRSLARSPGLVVMVVGSLGVGLGGATLVFSVARSLLYPAPGPLTDPERLVTIYESEPDGDPWGQVAFPNYEDIVRNVGALDGAAASRIGIVRIGDGEAGERVMVELVTGNWFDVLGIPTVLGRSFTPEESIIGAAAPRIVLSHEYWERAFGGDPAIVGTELPVDGRPHTVIGVAAPGITNRMLQIRVSGWIPLGIPGGTFNATEEELTNRADREYQVLGRLAAGAGLEEVEVQLAALSASLADADPAVWADDRGHPRALSAVEEAESRLAPELRAIMGVFVLLLFGATGLILAIACSNVAGLLLARGQRRVSEIAIRLSLGASSGRVVRMLLTESLLLAAAGSAVAVGLAVAVISRGSAIPLPGGLPDLAFGLRVDPWVMGFSLLLGSVCALAFGLAPALRIARSGGSLARGMRGGSSKGDARRLLVRLQVAGAVVFLVATGLLLRSVSHIGTADPGLEFDHVAVLHRTMDAEDGPGWAEQLAAEMRADPAFDRVELAASVEVSPFFDLASARIALPEAEEPVVVAMNSVTPGYADLLGLDLLRGRWLEESDRAGAIPVVVVNEAFVRRWIPEGDPIGRTLRIEEHRGVSTPLMTPPTVATIVGVAENVVNSPIDPPAPYLWASWSQFPVPSPVLHATSPLGPGAAAGELARRNGDRLTLVGPAPYTTLADGNTIGQRTIARVLAGAAGFGLVLTVVGLGGLLSVSVAMRLPELAIRRALGASAADVTSGVVGESLRLAASGVGIGFALALPLAWLARSVLPGVAPWDPVTLLGTVALLGLAAVTTALPPALRAARSHPLRWLRGE